MPRILAKGFEEYKMSLEVTFVHASINKMVN